MNDRRNTYRIRREKPEKSKLKWEYNLEWGNDSAILMLLVYAQGSHLSNTSSPDPQSHSYQLPITCKSDFHHSCGADMCICLYRLKFNLFSPDLLPSPRIAAQFLLVIESNPRWLQPKKSWFYPPTLPLYSKYLLHYENLPVLLNVVCFPSSL